jgi:hypothetical protein
MLFIEQATPGLFVIGAVERQAVKKLLVLGCRLKGRGNF